MPDVTYGDIRKALVDLRELNVSIPQIADATDSGQRSLYRYLEDGQDETRTVQRGSVLLDQLRQLYKLQRQLLSLSRTK